ncbi:MAG: hypothetical protein DWQ06_14130 [Calditrichaeota bacterium]|nr:MAG: hypothetical protein DWQ06_14130 [Calditrichota bacterium]
MKNILVTGLIFTLFSLSCAESPKAQAETEKPSESKTVKVDRGELKQIMFQMFANILEMKDKAKTNEKPKEESIQKMLEITEKLKGTDFGDTFLRKNDEFAKSVQAFDSTENYKETYTKMVNSCVSCHSVYAQSKVVMIKRHNLEED